MRELIKRKDKNGVQLREGDIVAESSIGAVIWGGKGVIRSRPLGIVVVHFKAEVFPDIEPEEADMYDVVQCRKGIVELTEKADDWMTVSEKGSNVLELNLSAWDSKFYGWDNVERIGSIYDLDA